MSSLKMTFSLASLVMIVRHWRSLRNPCNGTRFRNRRSTDDLHPTIILDGTRALTFQALVG